MSAAASAFAYRYLPTEARERVLVQEAGTGTTLATTSLGATITAYDVAMDDGLHIIAVAGRVRAIDPRTPAGAILSLPARSR